MILPAPFCSSIRSNNSNCWVEERRWTWHCYRYSVKFSFFEWQHQQDYKYKFNGKQQSNSSHTNLHHMRPRKSMIIILVHCYLTYW